MASPFDIGAVFQSIVPVIMVILVVVILISVFKELVGAFRSKTVAVPRIIRR